MFRKLALFVLAASMGLASAATYTLPFALQKLDNHRDFSGVEAPLGWVTPSQKAFLSQRGFVVSPDGFKQFYELYEQSRYLYLPVYVTTDSILHIFHVTFDKALRDLERQQFSPRLLKMNAGLVSASMKQYAAAKGTPMEVPAQKLLAYLVVAQKLADPKATIPDSVSDWVNSEMKLIDAHMGVDDSTLFDFKEDYSQYVPRGHYTRSDLLKNYFRSMMWLGRINFRLKDPTETRMAILLTRLISQNPEIQKLWTQIYEPTSFIVGKSDDLNFSQYAAIAQDIYGKTSTLADLASDEKLNLFRAKVQTLPDPKINSVVLDIQKDPNKIESSKGFRLMGQRFILDAFILNSLVFREVGTQDDPRLLPSSLDVFAALGSRTAWNILKAKGETRYENYETQMSRLRTSINQWTEKDWNETLYTGWLYTLKALIQPRDKSYPPYMQSDMWSRKDLNTAIGSWTELKHDLVLYSKQVMAEMGSGGPEFIPEGYVEPIVDVYKRLGMLAQKMKTGLKERNLMLDSVGQNLDALIEMGAFLEKVARLELSGKPRSSDDYERIFYYGGWLEAQTFAAMDPVGEEFAPNFEEEHQAALITDIATDPNGSALEVATGSVLPILVIVPNSKGKPQVAQGGIYSHYEFVVPLSKRMTDDGWRALLNSGKIPKQPEWVQTFVRP